MWIVCCRKQQDNAASTNTNKGNKSKDKSKHRKQKYSRGHKCDKTDPENSNNNNNKNNNNNNNNENNDTGCSNIDTKLRKDSHDSIINGCYPRQERRSLPDVVIPSTHLMPCSDLFPSNQRPSLHIDYETGRRPTIMVETTAKLAESESIGLDDKYSSSLFNKAFLTNDLKAHNEPTDSVLKVVRSVDDGKKTPFKKRLSLLKVKPLKRFRKSKESILSVDVQKPYTEDGKTNPLLSTPDTRFVFKAKSSFRRIKHSKLFSSAKSSHENILISKDANTSTINNNNESYSERSEDSLGQLPTPKNSLLKRINPRGADAYTDPRKLDEPIVTPFAQILASLRKVRTNFILLTNVTSTRE
ncbi:unnamed protein product [Trichobilharzia regenti]|nr:unnamed protein product [Trichobilharzia regenti]